MAEVKNVVTNPKRTDGFGAQFQTIIYAIIYAEQEGKTFIYTPFQQMEHNYDNDAQFLQKKEWLVNLKDSFPLNSNPHLQTISTIDFIRYFEQHLDVCAKSHALKNIKAIFRQNKDRSKYFGEGYHIAVHVRKHNLHDNRIDGTNTPDSVYLTTIERLRQKYTSHRPFFHLYSQGKEEDFKIYTGSDFVWHLNESVEDTFIGLVLADALVTSRSSFSYTAALLSEGSVYYMPFWHPSLPTWISLAN